MYYQHFRLTGPPFEAAADPEALYLSRAHRESLSALEWGLLHEPSGFTTLTGETGTGKTTLVYSILARHFSQLCAAYVINPKLSFEDILRVVLGQFGAPCEGTTKLDRIEALVGFLGRRMPHERLAIIVDEAQDLSNDVLEELRLLSNYGQQIGRYLQLVLVGQPELALRLRSPSLRQFNQRVAARSVLSRLSFDEAHEYVGYRLRARGGRSRDIFDSDALAYLLRHSNGIPRQINVLCHNAMLLAYSSEASRVPLKAARVAVAENGESLLNGFGVMTNPLTWQQSSLLGAAIGLFLFGTYIYKDMPKKPLHTQSRTSATVALESRTVAPDHEASLKATPTKVFATLPQTAAMAATRATLDDRPAATADSFVSSSNEAKPQRDNPAATVLPALLPDDLAIKHEQSGARQTANLLAPSAAPEADDQRRRVSVKYGDTLESLALHYLGSRYALNILIDANPQIENINKIYPGQKIYLSVAGDSRPKAAIDDRIASQHAASYDGPRSREPSGRDSSGSVKDER
jgi:general secretion pathway protein A